MAKAKAKAKAKPKAKVPEITIHGTKPNKGERMTNGAGWKLAATKGKRRIFAATLIDTVNKDGVRLAIFSVPK